MMSVKKKRGFFSRINSTSSYLSFKSGINFLLLLVNGIFDDVKYGYEKLHFLFGGIPVFIPIGQKKFIFFFGKQKI